MKKNIIIFLFLPILAFGFGTGTIKKIDEIKNNTGSDILLNPTDKVDIGYFTGEKVLQSTVDGELEESAVTNTTLTYLDATSSIQTQLDSKTPLVRILNTTAPLLIDAGASSDLSADRTFSITQSTTSTDGYLSSTDWNTFNNKSDYISPLTTNGDLLYYNSGEQRLPIDTDGKILSIQSGLPSWIDAPSSSPTTTQGDIIQRGVTEDERLPIGTNGQVLTVNGSVANWQDATAAASFTTVTKSSTTTLTTTNEDNVICDSGSGNVTLNLPAASGNSGLTYKITNLSDSNTCTIDANASETIGGELTVVLESFNDNIIITTDGSNWFYLSDDVRYTARATSNNGAAISTSGATVIFEDEVYDTHSAYNSATGVYTAPIDGVYSIEAAIKSATGTYSTGNLLGISIKTNGSTISATTFHRFNSTYNSTYSVDISSIILLSEGETVEIDGIKTGTGVNLTAETNANHISIVRVK